MRIEIAERLRPFSHLPGTSFVLPGSRLSLHIFPALIRIYDLTGPCGVLLAEINLEIVGPLDGFTALLDLEQGKLKVSGHSALGYIRYVVKALEGLQGISMLFEKAPCDSMAFRCSGEWTAKKTEIKIDEEVIFSEKPLCDHTIFSLPSSEKMERLSLGSHKLQDWELVCRRSSFTEIFPIWYRLGLMIPQQFVEATGTALLLNECQQAIKANAPEKILKTFHNLFLAGFEGVLSPNLKDIAFQGIRYCGDDLAHTCQVKGSPLTLLVEGARLIRSLFIQESPKAAYILPSLPPEFHCGRLLHTKCGKQGAVSLEWTKKTVRRMTFLPLESQNMAFFFSNHEKNCRLRTSYKDKGISYIPGTPMNFSAGKSYWFDNFKR